jgi:hypothetical protein
LGGDEFDRVSKNYPWDSEGQIEVVIAHALDDFHISYANIDFALIQEVDVKASQIINVFFSLVQQVSAIQDLGYVSANHHGDYVLKINMGIKQNYMPSVPSKPNMVGVLPPKGVNTLGYTIVKCIY